MLFSDFPSIAQHYGVTVTTWECKSIDELVLIWLLEHMESILPPNPRLCKTVFNTKPEYNANICSASL